MTDEQIEHMVTRFLCWRLPDDFQPDGGIEITFPHVKEATGTNLLTATQAEQMIRHIVDGLPARTPQTTGESDG